jgi:hypothetical protein
MLHNHLAPLFEDSLFVLLGGGDDLIKLGVAKGRDGV